MIQSLCLMFYLFFKIGLFSFGGGLAMLPIIFQTVSSYGLMGSDEFANLVAISQVTPGPMVVNAATYLGFNYAGLAGAFIATLGVAIPSFAVVIVAVKFLSKFNDSKIVQGVMKGIRPATVGLIAAGVTFLAQEVQLAIVPIAICGATIIMSGYFKINPIIITVIMAIAGGLLCG